MSSPNNGSEVSKTVMTKGIDAFAEEADNTKNPDPPLDASGMNPGPGKNQGEPN